MNRTLLLAVGLALALSAPAHATPRFPDVIQEVVGTRGPPPCDLCHLGDLRTSYAVRTAFGLSLKARGLVPGDEDSLRQALERLREQDVDSDGDGVGDITELEAGSNPNVPGDRSPGPEIKYGCSVPLRGHSTAESVGAALLALSIVLVRRRKPYAGRV